MDRALKKFAVLRESPGSVSRLWKEAETFAVQIFVVKCDFAVRSTSKSGCFQWCPVEGVQPFSGQLVPLRRLSLALRQCAKGILIECVIFEDKRDGVEGHLRTPDSNTC